MQTRLGLNDRCTKTCFRQDELLWGAAWLRRASSDDTYLRYLQNNGKTLGADDNINEFGWDNKHAGINVLVSKVSVNLTKASTLVFDFLIYLYQANQSKMLKLPYNCI